MLLNADSYKDASLHMLVLVTQVDANKYIRYISTIVLFTDLGHYALELNHFLYQVPCYHHGSIHQTFTRGRYHQQN